MFNQEEFSKILTKINCSYDTMTDFAKKASFDRTYISKYINKKLKNPPTPKILEKIANASNGITTYTELMIICGYIEKNSSFGKNFNKINDFQNKFKEMYKGLNLSSIEGKYFNDYMKKFLEMTFEQHIDQKQALENIERELKNNIKDIQSCTKIIKAIKININSLILESNLYELDSMLLNKSKDLTPKYYMCPVYGRISAGQPNWAEECIEGRIPIDPDLMNIAEPEECFFLRVNGESMNKEIKNGAYALIRKTDVVENGDIAVVLVNGYDATLKKFTKNGDVVVLEPMSNDPSFQTQIYTKETPIKIIGKYIGKMEMK